MVTRETPGRHGPANGPTGCGKPVSARTADENTAGFQGKPASGLQDFKVNQSLVWPKQNERRASYQYCKYGCCGSQRIYPEFCMFT